MGNAHPMDLSDLTAEGMVDHGAPVPLVRPGSFSDGGTPSEESLAREWVAIHRTGWRYDHTAAA